MTYPRTTWTPGDPVQLPDGSAGVVDVAPPSDPIAPGQHTADRNGPMVYIVWPANVRGGRAGCWWRPEALSTAGSRGR